MHVKRDTSMVR